MPKILCVDDEQMIRETIADYLEDSGYNCITADNGGEGLRLFFDQSPDVVLVDLHMPDIGGIDILKEINENNSEVPVIVISGAGKMEYVIEALRFGAWDYLMKPLKDMGILEHAIEKGLERSKLIKENRMYRENLENLVRERTLDLEKSQTEYKDLFSSMMNAFSVNEIILDEKGEPYDYRILKINPAFERVTGFKQEELIGKTLREVNTHVDETLIHTYGDLALNGGFLEFTYKMPQLNVYLRIYAFSPAKGIFATLFDDVTEKKLAEQRLKNSLNEKEILLKEVHHRVKNNLQIISAILGLEEIRSENEQTSFILGNCKARVDTMALIHKQLYEYQHLSKINLSQFTDQLLMALSARFNQNGRKINAIKSVGSLFLNIDQAIPLGLIANELISNIFLHAYPDTKQGDFKIEIKEVDDFILFKIEDFGSSNLNTIDLENPQTLGLQFVKALISQLDADFKTDTSKGFKIEIKFKITDWAEQRIDFNQNKEKVR